MPIIQKVTDPQRIVTDPVLISALTKRGIDKDYVEFVQDYAKRVKGKSSPYMKLYRDLKSNKRFAVISSLPMVDADGVKIEAGWKEADISYFAEKNNLFRCKVQGTQVEITIRNNQPDGRKAGDKLTFKPQLFLDGVEQKPNSPSLLGADPVNPNYSQNVLEWDYGICKRRLRIIEGRLLGSWVFPTNPGREVRVKYNQLGSYRLKLGQFAINKDEELISQSVFDKAEYPFVISDSDTFYPDANPETSSVDGYVQHAVDNSAWATIQGGAGNYADANTADNCSIRLNTGSTSGWYYIGRVILLFDTSSLGAAASISAATLSIYGHTKLDGISITPTVNIYSSNPASPTALAAGDFDSLGTTAFSTAITFAGFSVAGYNDFALNASGLAAIDKVGISKFGAREATYDAPNSEPGAYGTNQASYMIGYFAEQGDGFKPKLVITYTLAQAVGGGSITPAGVLGRNIFIAIGSGSITPAGVLGRNIFKAIGAGSITPSGLLSSLAKIQMGQGTVTPAGVLGRLVKIVTGSGTITPIGALTYLVKRYKTITSFTGRDLSDDNVRDLKDFTGRDLK